MVFRPDPRFVAVHLIPESDNPEDDKIYLFFRENAIDGEHAGKATHARIGQLCKVEFSCNRRRSSRPAQTIQAGPMLEIFRD